MLREEMAAAQESAAQDAAASMTVTFLDKGGFPLKSGAGDSVLSNRDTLHIPPGADSALVYLDTSGAVSVKVIAAEAGGAQVICAPVNSLGFLDGDIFIDAPAKYSINLQGVEIAPNGRLKLLFEQKPLAPEEAHLRLMAIVEGQKSDLWRKTSENLKLRREFEAIFNSRAWRVVRVYYRLKDAAKWLVFKLPKKPRHIAERLAEALGFARRSLASDPARMVRLEYIYRPRDRKSYKVSELTPLSRMETGETIAVSLHLFFFDLLDVFIAHLLFIPFEFDLFVSVPPGVDAGAVSDAFSENARIGRVTVETVENRGRDIASMVDVFGQRLAGYDYILRLHSKKSKHQGSLSGWLDMLLYCLIQSEEHVRKILGFFASHPDLGIICADPPGDIPYWTLTADSNREDMRRLFARVGSRWDESERYLDFPCGSMYWARGRAIRNLLTSGIRTDEFPEESGQLDGTLAHAVERGLGIIAADAGYRLAQSNGDSLNLGAGRKNLFSYLSLSMRDMKRFIGGGPVSFDLFGTLVYCEFDRNPEKLFGEIDKQYPGFSEFRAEAGRLAGKYRGDIHQIYFELRRLSGWAQEMCERIKELEYELLLGACRPRAEVAAFLADIRKANANANADIVITEDTPWTHAYIDGVLARCGIPEHELFLSSKYGHTKHEGGMYELLKGYFMGRSYTHVGDDTWDDLHVPNNRSVRTFHIMNPEDMAEVAGLDTAELSRYAQRLQDDPFCLFDVMEQIAAESGIVGEG